MSEICGTGLGNFPAPGDPVGMDTSVLTATARKDGIDVAWTYPSVLPQAVAHTILYRSTTSVWSSSVESAGIVVAGSYYFHQVPLVANTTHYYWIKIVSVNGTYGTLIGPASATMLPSHQYIVDTLVGQIQESQLTALLRTRINEIDVVAADLLTEGVARLAQDSVFSGLLTQQISDLAATDTLVANEVVQRTSANNALAAQMTAVVATAAGNTAAVITEQSARATADSAEATARQALGVTFGNNLAAAITAERLVRVNAEGALAQDITNVSVAFAAGDAAERVVNAAAIEAERLTLADADTVMATSIDTLQIDLGLEQGKIQTLQTVVGDVNSGLVAEYSVRLDVNGHVSGFGLLNNGTSSEFIVNADKFAIIKPGYGAAEVPFVIGTVAGATRIVLNAASYIADATITTAKIGNAQVETLSIAGNAVTVSDAVTPTYSSNTRDVTLAMQGDSTLGVGQKFIFHVNGIVGDNGSNPSTYDMRITTTLANGYGVIDTHWFYAYGPDSWTVTRTLTANSQIARCRVQLLMHGTNTPVPNGHITITAHGGKR